MTEKQQRFIKLLEEIFEINKSDLDFGIYRILNYKRADISRFFRESLPSLIKSELKPFADNNKNTILRRMSDIESQLGGKDTIALLPDNIPLAAEYRSLQKELSLCFDMTAIEADVYSALFSFFNRYYDEGDFISKRRYKEGIYAIPYEGEEVKLYWANEDQFYIKTSENFRDYTFHADDITVHFRLTDATTEQDNNKEDDKSRRVFMLVDEVSDIKPFSYDEKTKQLIVRFIYDIPADKRKKYTEINAKRVIEYITSELKDISAKLLRNVAKNKKDNEPLILKHLKRYVAKNSFDYFIHKDLNGFLSRELDFYIKNEILYLDDIETDQVERNQIFFAKICAIKKVARIIIDFLAQIENYQKKLWLKKKFVIDTNWCITLDLIDTSFYPEIAANKAQISDWINLFAIDELASSEYANSISVDFLIENPYLVLDTRHFSTEFKNRLVASIENLDDKTNGIMLNCENFQALNFLLNKYKAKTDVIYIDPPYNTDSVPILYKNGYKDSSWLCLMNDRIRLGKAFLKNSGIQCTAIDDYENPNLNLLLKSIYGASPYTVVTKVKPSGRPIPNGFAISHDYGLFNKNNPTTPISRLTHSDEQLNRYRETDDKGHFFWEMLRKAGSHNTKEDRPTMFYPLYLNAQNGSLRIPKIHYNNLTEEFDILEETNTNEIVIYPIRDDGSYGCWYFGVENLRPRISELKAVRQPNGNYFVYYRRRPNDGVQPLTTWDESKNSATEHGTGLIKKMFGDNKVFSYPKSLYTVIDSLRVSGIKANSLVLDYFAGSATTGHATITLNRKNGWHIKYILIEMGEYFDTVTKPRILKSIYADSWNNGKPSNRCTGVSQIVKYMRLESYEDTLNNIRLHSNRRVIPFGDEYLVRYMLNNESRESMMNLSHFQNPFDCKMHVTEKNEHHLRTIDIVETFNYLIGLSVDSKSDIHIFSAIPASDPRYEGASDLAPDTNGEFKFQQLIGTLPDGRRALIIWRSITADIIKSNTALDAYFKKLRISNFSDCAFDVIFVNGDNNLDNMRLDDETWEVILIETEFLKRMWEE